MNAPVKVQMSALEMIYIHSLSLKEGKAGWMIRGMGRNVTVSNKW